MNRGKRGGIVFIMSRRTHLRKTRRRSVVFPAPSKTVAISSLPRVLIGGALEYRSPSPPYSVSYEPPSYQSNVEIWIPQSVIEIDPDANATEPPAYEESGKIPFESIPEFSPIPAVIREFMNRTIVGKYSTEDNEAGDAAAEEFLKMLQGKLSVVQQQAISMLLQVAPRNRLSYPLHQFFPEHYASVYDSDFEHRVICCTEDPEDPAWYRPYMPLYLISTGKSKLAVELLLTLHEIFPRDWENDSAEIVDVGWDIIDHDCIHAAIRIDDVHVIRTIITLSPGQKFTTLHYLAYFYTAVVFKRPNAAAVLYNMVVDRDLTTLGPFSGRLKEFYLYKRYVPEYWTSPLQASKVTDTSSPIDLDNWDPREFSTLFPKWLIGIPSLWSISDIIHVNQLKFTHTNWVPFAREAALQRSIDRLNKAAQETGGDTDANYQAIMDCITEDWQNLSLENNTQQKKL
ncbi:hypothetical protein IWQ62_004016 [Dispira parvispora]|uniref:Uncharacterized protein n=1 Tax=Dispira parvispora TaxID=1520584 RepID=A0A9W8E606_9FUNG|nr:hypothetical protein IWQ62_004016 [Dispira parvispora]